MDSTSTAVADYAAFLEKVKRTVYVDNLSPQVTESVMRTALGQFGTVKNVQFIPNYTGPKNMSCCALVEMECLRQAEAVVSEITQFPFMMSGMPRPARAFRAEVEMFDDRPIKPGRRIQCRWVDRKDPDFEVASKIKRLVRKHAAEDLFLLQQQLAQEEKLAKQQEETLKANYKKFTIIDNVVSDGTAPGLANKIIIRLSKLIVLDHEFKSVDFSEYYCSIVAIFSFKTALKWRGEMGGSSLTHIYPIKIHLCIALDDIFFLHKFLISHHKSNPHSIKAITSLLATFITLTIPQLSDPFLSILNGYQLFTVPQVPSIPPQQHLSNQNFREADEETRRLLIVLAGEAAQTRGYVFFSEVQFISEEDLKVIDELWKNHSNKKFGYSVQKRIWQLKANKDFTKFFIKVGWMKKLDTEVEQYNYRAFPNEFIWDLNDGTPEGHLPLTNALRGTQLLKNILNHPAFEVDIEEGEGDKVEGNENGGLKGLRDSSKLPLSKRVLKTDYSF
ncbi:hypothetical protein POTOM_054590 [Populus tomentosa]|uniref:RRM domain-containing protein n=1 Tax=Populus tomentosa TaxID=118781 RepID=A0A8X7XZ43_POPTO|nr:hypothetical protein POTOM_054590 [Populus tomentosa]